jgi:hypothetical protein
MAVEVIDKIKPKNGGSFPIVEAVDVEVSEGVRLSNALSELKVFVTPEMYGAVGDGETDDSEALQAAYDYAYEHGMTLKLSSKVYAISEPLYIHSTKRNYNNNVNKHRVNGARLIGSGRGESVIKKISNNVDKIYGKDAVIILTTTDEYNEIASSLIARYFIIENVTIDTESKCNFGIYADAFYFADIVNVIINNCGSGIAAGRQSCYNRFISVEVNFCDAGFNFGLSTNPNQTTNYFESCHTNGIERYGYSLDARATLVNCSQDGGNGMFILAKNAVGISRPNIKMINCHHESLTASYCVKAETADVIIEGGYYLIPTNGNPLFLAQNNSRIKCIDVIFDKSASTPKKDLYQSVLSSVNVKTDPVRAARFFTAPRIRTAGEEVLYYEGEEDKISINGNVKLIKLWRVDTINHTRIVFEMIGETEENTYIDCISSDSSEYDNPETHQIGVSAIYELVPVNHTNYPDVVDGGVFMLDLTQFDEPQYIALRMTNADSIRVINIIAE